MVVDLHRCDHTPCHLTTQGRTRLAINPGNTPACQLPQYTGWNAESSLPRHTYRAASKIATIVLRRRLASKGDEIAGSTGKENYPPSLETHAGTGGTDFLLPPSAEITEGNQKTLDRTAAATSS